MNQMASSSWLLVFLCSSALFLQLCSGAVYKVGDSAGWTTIGGVDYKKWAANISFHVGDTILFVYNKQYHDVRQVTYEGYKTCNASSPIATHTSGNDSFTITGYGHHFFLCGFPGHCQSGQKVDINALRPGTTPPPAVHPPPSVLPLSPAPAPSVAAPRFVSNGLFINVALAVIVVIGTLINV